MPVPWRGGRARRRVVNEEVSVAVAVGVKHVNTGELEDLAHQCFVSLMKQK